jgi:hypothetical protein
MVYKLKHGRGHAYRSTSRYLLNLPPARWRSGKSPPRTRLRRSSEQSTSWRRRSDEFCSSSLRRALTRLNLALAHYLCGDTDAAQKSIDAARAEPPTAAYAAFLWDLDIAYNAVDEWRQ